MLSWIKTCFKKILLENTEAQKEITSQNFLEIDTQVELNIKQIEFYHSLYERNQNKFSFLVIIYSFICFYIIELFRYAFTPLNEPQDYIYLIGLLLLIIFIIISIAKTHKLLRPIDVAYLHEPKYFYKNLYEEYKISLNTDDQETLNEYVKTSYLLETEKVLTHNMQVFISKSNDFYISFKSLFYTLILYILLSSYVIVQKKDEKPEVIIENFKEIINYTDTTIMSKSEKPKVDPTKVIKTQPVMVRESINLSKERPKTSTKATEGDKSTK